jgi:hypothetical protein
MVEGPRPGLTLPQGTPPANPCNKVTMDLNNDVERIALEMIKRFGGGAARIARELAEIADVLTDLSSAEKWSNIARTIERLQSKP